MTDFIKSLQSLDALHKEAESWTSDNIEVTVAASHNSDEPATINLASTLGHNKRISPAKHKKNSNDIYWLPSSLSTGGDNAEFLQTTLVPIFLHHAAMLGLQLHPRDGRIHAVHLAAVSKRKEALASS